MTSSRELLEIVERVREIGALAESVVLEVYQKPFEVEFKGPSDPVTLADKRANELILRELERSFPGVPVVAEESGPESYADFGSAERVFFVDPVDGTSEFVKKTGEFCIMIGLAIGGHAALGVIVAPALGTRFEGIVGTDDREPYAQMTAKDGSVRPLRVSGLTDFAEGLCVISRSHFSAPTAHALDQLGIHRREPYGSAGLKAMRVADGSALCYLHAGYAGSRWDLAAPEAICRAAGGSYTDLRGLAYRYDDPDLKNGRGVLALPQALAGRAAQLLGRDG